MYYRTCDASAQPMHPVVYRVAGQVSQNPQLLSGTPVGVGRVPTYLGIRSDGVQSSIPRQLPFVAPAVECAAARPQGVFAFTCSTAPTGHNLPARYAPPGNAESFTAAAVAPPALKVVEPESLLCPITQAMYRDPCFVPESGNTYELDALEHYWASTPEPRDPLTNTILKSKVTYPNWGIRREVQRFLDDHPDYLPQGWVERQVPRARSPAEPEESTERCLPRLSLLQRHGEPFRQFLSTLREAVRLHRSRASRASHSRIGLMIS